MTNFVLAAAALLAAALAILLVPLLRAPRRGLAADRPAENAAIYRDQLAELERDLQSGLIAREQFESAREELKRRMLQDLPEGELPLRAPRGPRPGARWAMPLALGLFVPLAAVLLYLRLGSPESVQMAAYMDGRELSREDVESMVRTLATRVEKNPGDVRGWALLGRSYFSLGRYAESVKAYERALPLGPDDPELLVGLAVALHMAHGYSSAPRLEALAAKALAIEPDHPGALALAGGAAFERGDYRTAIRRWEHLVALLPENASAAPIIKAQLEEARSRAASANTAALQGKARDARAPRAGVSGTVRLGAAVAGGAAPEDALFVYARPVDGSRMPIAILKRTVKDLPLEFSLDDTMAMTPGRSLSVYSEVVVIARVSKSGSAVPQPGDLQGSTAPVKVGSAGVDVIIDRRVP